MKNFKIYGYRIIYALLKKGTCASEKIVQKIIYEFGLKVQIKRRSKYKSYKGEITPAVPNIIELDFFADAPNQTWLTDITEFSTPSGKVYLSPVVDCFNGMLRHKKLVAFHIKKRILR